jgi:two-component system CheB/CheR fusion protein
MLPGKADELRVLVIDDDIDAANSLSYLLQISGYPTAVAYGGKMGLRLAQLFKPALVFLDLRMPGEDGCEVVARALRDGTLPPALYVCLTGVSEPAAESQCLAAGFNFFVHKPIQPEALREILRAARSHAGLRRQSAPGDRRPELLDRRAH